MNLSAIRFPAAFWAVAAVLRSARGEDELRERFNRALAGIIEDGTYSEITAKYFPFPVMEGVE